MIKQLEEKIVTKIIELTSNGKIHWNLIDSKNSTRVFYLSTNGSFGFYIFPYSINYEMIPAEKGNPDYILKVENIEILCGSSYEGTCIKKRLKELSNTISAIAEISFDDAQHMKYSFKLEKYKG